MATQTLNLGLVKPAGNERPLIGVLNSNADKIDAAIGDVDVTQDGSLQDQIDSIQDSVNRILMSGITRISVGHWGDGLQGGVDILFYVSSSDYYLFSLNAQYNQIILQYFQNNQIVYNKFALLSDYS